MGYLALKQPVTVTFNDGTRRTFAPGVNRDVTKEQSEHWYVKAAGGEYFEKIEDAHKNVPEMKQNAAARRADWEQTQRGALLAAINAETARKDLLALEKEMGIDSKKLDADFKATLKDEEDRMKKLMSEAEEADAEQKSQDAKSALTSGEAEKIAAGSAENANTAMDGAAKAEADKKLEAQGKTIVNDTAVEKSTLQEAAAKEAEANKEAAKTGAGTGTGTSSTKK